jgi:phage tail-like protein
MPEGQATPSAYFVAELGGKQIGAFRKISGLKYDTKVIEVRTVDANGLPVLEKVSAATETGDIQIERYADSDSTMFKWAQEVAEKGAAAAKRDITFRRVSYTGETIETFSLKSAWPKSYVAAELSATGDVAGEQLVLVHEGFEKV